jgi:hypothetical protein
MTALLLVAVALAFAGVLHLHRSSGNSSAHPVRSKSILLFGSLLCLGPLVLTSIMIRSWAPYYSAYPAMGLAILTGSALSRVHLSWRLAFVVMFFAMGVWTRENSLDARVATEKNFRVTSPALREVSANFKRLVRQFPPKSQVLITVEARGNAGVYTHMFTFGALRVWYAEPTIRARRPEDRVASGTPEYLFAITPDLDVVEIDRETLRAQTASGRDPDYAYVAPAVRAYCTGLFGSGETDRAVDILLHMQEINPKLQSVHWRTAATFLLADGRIADADSILHQALPLSRALALANMRAVLAERPPGRILDDAALHAFDIEPDDAEAIRELMRWFAKFGYAEPALRFADRLERLSPGDSEAAATIRKMSWILDQRRRAPPAPGAL